MVDFDDMHSFDFNYVCNGNDYDLNDTPDAKPLEESDATLVSGSLTHERDEVTIIHGNREEHGDGHEAAKGGCRDLEGGAEAAVQGGALFDKKGVDLCPYGAWD